MWPVWGVIVTQWTIMYRWMPSLFCSIKTSATWVALEFGWLSDDAHLFARFPTDEHINVTHLMTIKSQN
jgi:hypothetical protein